MAPLQLTVVGGGFTGVMVAVHAINASRVPLAITIVEPAAELGRGVAYGTRDPAHRINVPSQRMATSAADPEGPTRWLLAQGAADESSADAEGHFYVPRHAYGSYVQDLLRETIAAAGARVTMRHAMGAAASLHRSRDGWQVVLRCGSRLSADAVALCFGHAAPALPCPVAAEALTDPRFVASPWGEGSLGSIGADDTVLIVGTGLTMADTVASLAARRHRGMVTAASRRALLPRPHGAFVNDLDVLHGAPAPQTALGLLVLVREAVDRYAALGWQPAVDSVRAQLPDLWGALPASEKRKVVRRLLPFWEVHRFRIAPQIAATIADARRRGQLAIVAAGVTGVERTNGRFRVTLRQAGGRDRQEDYDSVILCTGPRKDLTRDPLAADLLAQGLARLDDVGSGFAVDDRSCMLDASGAPQHDLFAFGPLTRGTFGEMTGAPDIARHVEASTQRFFRSFAARAAAPASGSLGRAAL